MIVPVIGTRRPWHRLLGYPDSPKLKRRLMHKRFFLEGFLFPRGYLFVSFDCRLSNTYHRHPYSLEGLTENLGLLTPPLHQSPKMPSACASTTSQGAGDPPEKRNDNEPTKPTSAGKRKKSKGKKKGKKAGSRAQSPCCSTTSSADQGMPAPDVENTAAWRPYGCGPHDQQQPQPTPYQHLQPNPQHGYGYGHPYGAPWYNQPYGPPVPFFNQLLHYGLGHGSAPYFGPPQMNNPGRFFVEPALREMWAAHLQASATRSIDDGAASQPSGPQLEETEAGAASVQQNEAEAIEPAGAQLEAESELEAASGQPKEDPSEPAGPSLEVASETDGAGVGQQNEDPNEPAGPPPEVTSETDVAPVGQPEEEEAKGE